MSVQENTTSEFVPFKAYSANGDAFFYVKAPHDQAHARELLSIKLEKLAALTTCITGSGFTSFDSLADKLKQAYLDNLDDLAHECVELANLAL